MHKRVLLLLAAVLAASLTDCGGANNPTNLTPRVLPQSHATRGGAPNVVIYWDQAALQSIRNSGAGPTVAARALAIVHTATYDSWAIYNQRRPSLFDPVSIPVHDRDGAHVDEAISFAAYRALLDLFPTQASMYIADMTQLGYDPNDNSRDPTTPSGLGNDVAAVILAFRHHDGSNQLGDLHPGAYSDYTGYVPVNTPQKINDPNRWQPLLIANADGTTTEQIYTTPFWGLVKPFALLSGAELRPGPPAKYPSSTYTAQAQQILDYSANLDDETKVIAEYWRNGPHSETPPGHWCLFAQYVSARDHHNLGQDAEMFFALTNALLDASIAAWDAKRPYDSERPITAVHWLFTGKKIRAWAGPFKGTRLIDGSMWIPYQPPNIVTPPFPEFISGHSTFSAAAAEVLKSYTGSDFFGDSAVFLAGSSTVEPGAVPASNVTLYWPTFTDAAVQAGLSRRYGGIHFEQGDLVGRAIGREVGVIAWKKAQRIFGNRWLR